VLGDVEVADAATIVRQDDEDIQNPQTNRCNGKEIYRYHLPKMISKNVIHV